MTKDTKDIALKVIKTEMDGLKRLYDSIDDNFVKAVNIITSTTGKVVVTGMGKSGHIGCKIAATMASTGTQAYFVHPSEASHGDLGMISKDDCVIAISNSGETKELYDVINYCKRNEIPLIGITRSPASTLATASIPLIIPNSKEACPLGLAPTTSTTVSLVLGDALAVAAYEDSFNAKSFSEFHPGGKLGSKLLTVGDLMHSAPTVGKSTLVGDGIITMTQKSFGCLAVTDNGDLIGIITDGDIRRHLDSIEMKAPIESIMSKNPRTITKTMLAVEALAIMNKKSITSLFVLDGDALGIIHIHDCLRAGVDG